LRVVFLVWCFGASATSIKRRRQGQSGTLELVLEKGLVK
jgi:hypothetical protein